MSVSFVCFVIAAVIFLLFAVKVDLGDLVRWDFLAFFFVALGLALSLVPSTFWPVVRRPNP